MGSKSFDITFVNSTITNCDYGLYVETTANLYVRNCQFTNLGNTGLIINNYAETEMISIVITDSIFNSNNGYASAISTDCASNVRKQISIFLARLQAYRADISFNQNTACYYSITIKDSELSQSSKLIYVKAIAAAKTAPRLFVANVNFIISYGSYGIYLEQASSNCFNDWNISVINSTFQMQSNGAGIVITGYSCNTHLEINKTSSFALINSQFETCTSCYTQFVVSSTNPLFQHVTIKNNYYWPNAGQGILLSLSAALTFEFSGNTMEAVNEPLELDFMYSSTDISISNNSFLHSKSFAINIYADKLQQARIENNVFIDTTGDVIMLDTVNATLRTNVINSAAAECLMKTETKDASLETIDAAFNYWGTIFPAEIQNRLCDHDSGAPNITFSPFYTDASLHNISYGDVQFQIIGNLVGGEVYENKNETIPYSAIPYEVVAPIVINKGGSLMISAGVKLLFHNNIAVTAKGTRGDAASR